MDLIESSLRNIRLFKAQIELRGLPLKDIQTIRRTLRPLNVVPKGASQATGQPFGSVASRCRTCPAVKLNV